MLMGPCILSIFQYISNKMQCYTVYLYLETALHVSGGTSTHHQECIQLYLQHLVFVTLLLLSGAISWIPLPSRCCILYIFSTNISTEYFKHAAHSLFFSSKCHLFHNIPFFGSCIIHILRTGCAKI
jgi:hypothetical protein